MHGYSAHTPGSLGLASRTQRSLPPQRKTQSPIGAVPTALIAFSFRRARSGPSRLLGEFRIHTAVTTGGVAHPDAHNGHYRSRSARGRSAAVAFLAPTTRASGRSDAESAAACRLLDQDDTHKSSRFFCFVLFWFLFLCFVVVVVVVVVTIVGVVGNSCVFDRGFRGFVHV